MNNERENYLKSNNIKRGEIIESLKDISIININSMGPMMATNNNGYQNYIYIPKGIIGKLDGTKLKNTLLSRNKITHLYVKWDKPSYNNYTVYYPLGNLGFNS